MKTLLTFHGKQAIKDKYIQRILAHHEADNLIQSYGYWRGGKGCAVGCTLEVDDKPHKEYPTQLGLPVWLAHLEDHVFEDLSIKESKGWALDFLEAIPVGVEIPDSMRDRFQIFWLERQKSQIDQVKYHEVTTAVDDIINLLKEAVGGNEPKAEVWLHAYSVANLEASSVTEPSMWTPACVTARSAARCAVRVVARSAEYSASISAAVTSAGQSAMRSLAVPTAKTEAKLKTKSTLELIIHQEARVKRDWLLNELKSLK